MPPVARDDKVGYGKPPQSSRWKPGQSGNPKGRPRVDRTGLLQEAALILSEPVTARNAHTVRRSGWARWKPPTSPCAPGHQGR